MFAEVTRLYQTPVQYSRDHLRQRYDQPAAAAGWCIVPVRDSPGSLSAVYCKQTGKRRSVARVSSATYAEKRPAAPAVEVLFSAGPDGTKCAFNEPLDPESDPVD